MHSRRGRAWAFHLRDAILQITCWWNTLNPFLFLITVPVGKPITTTAHNTSSSSIYISWKSPPTDTILGEFLGYRITYRIRDKHNDTAKEIYIRDSSVEVSIHYLVFRSQPIQFTSLKWDISLDCEKSKPPYPHAYTKAIHSNMKVCARFQNSQIYYYMWYFSMLMFPLPQQETRKTGKKKSTMRFVCCPNSYKLFRRDGKNILTRREEVNGRDL